MEFWGVEVKAGEPFKLVLKKGKCLHLSQASLGEIRKDKGHQSVNLFVKVNQSKLVIATLTPEKLPQQLLDLAFTTGAEFAHNGTNGSVYLLGYVSDIDLNSEDEDSPDSEDEPLPTISGIHPAQVKEEKPAAAEITKELPAGKKKVKVVGPSKHVEADDDDDEDSSEDEDALSTDGSSEDDEDTKDGSDEDDSKDGSDEDDNGDSDEDDDSEEEDEKTTPKVQPGSKKRPAESTKTPVTDKKAKLVTPQKTDGKKGNVHVATPHPSKHGGKTPANKPNQQTPKSEVSHSCKPCNRSFKTENALDSHNKAKHTGK